MNCAGHGRHITLIDMRMPFATGFVPVLGMLVAASVPLVRHTATQRDERTAIEVLAQVQAAQEAYRRGTGGYATAVASLMQPCVASAPLPESALTRLARAGYVVSMRAATGAAAAGNDCHAREIVTDYYVAVAPASAATLGREAFARRGSGDVYLFVDGVAPREADIDSGLATPLPQRESFKIP
jgi:type II secretory pathway pseudopilin PulG